MNRLGCGTPEEMCDPRPIWVPPPPTRCRHDDLRQSVFQVVIAADVAGILSRDAVSCMRKLHPRVSAGSVTSALSRAIRSGALRRENRRYYAV